MKKLNLVLILIIVLPLAINAEKYTILKPFSWDELQLFQLDSLLSAQELNLSTSCPNSLIDLEQNYSKGRTFLKHILSTSYIWTEFSGEKSGEFCLVKHERAGFFNTDVASDDKPQGSYELLSTLQAQILISASRSVGFETKEIHRNIIRMNLENQRIRDSVFDIYGGRTAVREYIKNNPPAFPESEESRLLRIVTDENGITSSKGFTLIETLDLFYSEVQKQEMITLANQNKLKKTPMKKTHQLN